MKKIMFYCQYLAGMGHLVRSTEIVRSLVKDFQVCFVNGGQPIAEFELPSNIEIVHLPPLVEEDGELKTVDDAQPVEAVKASRQQQLLSVFEQFQPDCLITECFPFSKHRVKFELIPLIEKAKSSPQPVKIVCSLRDLVMTQSLSAKAWAKKYDQVCDLVNQYFDLILFHGDPQLQRLEDFFPKVDHLNCEVYYTGYVAQSPPNLLPAAAKDRVDLNPTEPTILASVGGGRFGYELLNAVVDASTVLSGTIPHRIHAFAGPFMPEVQFLQLQATAVKRSNLILRRFTPHLINYMKRADLSISLGGYNTTMNILSTGTRALVFPFISENQSGEQSIRAKKLEQMGILRVLYPEDLTGRRLAAKVLSSLDQAPVAHRFDLNGAEKSALKLKQLLYGVAAAA
jgi:predicted glycosyltransferase